tara:strand:- start:138622 stop:139779 length:1158 start_codon:yes stop_codon:yes gene_type:complete
MSALARKHGAVDLAQGFPSIPGPQLVQEHTANILVAGDHQYTSTQGPIALREALANDAKKRFGTELDPNTQVVVTTGAQDALGCAVLGLVEPGDEIVILEPFYTPCVMLAQLAHATIRYVSLEGPSFELREERLMSAMSNRTKLILFNSPNNPSGRVLSRDELKMIGRAALKYDAYIISDEVYEFFVYDGHRHCSILELPEIADRAIAISSFSKTFLMTGWRVGWARGAAHLVKAIDGVHTLMSHSLPAFLCEGVRFALEELPPNYYTDLVATHQRKRDLLCDELTRCGLKVLRPEGSIFCTLDIRSLGEDDDVSFCLRAPKELGIAVVPMSLTWHGRTAGRHFVRMCFSKSDEMLERGAKALCSGHRAEPSFVGSTDGSQSSLG